MQHVEADQPGYKQRADAITNAMRSAFSTGITTDTTLLQAPVSITNTRLEKGFNSESHLPSSMRLRERANLRPSTATVEPFMPIAFSNTKQEQQTLKGYNHLVTPVTLPSKFNYDNAYFNAAAAPFASTKPNNQHVHTTSSNRLKLMPNANLNSVAATGTVRYDTTPTLIRAPYSHVNGANFRPIQSSKIDHDRRNSHNSPQWSNENFSNVFELVAHQPKVSPNITSGSNFSSQNNNDATSPLDNFVNSDHRSTQPYSSMLTISVPAHTTQQVTSLPKFAFTPITFPYKTGFSKTQSWMSPSSLSQTSFTTTTPREIGESLAVPLEVDYDTGPSSQTTRYPELTNDVESLFTKANLLGSSQTTIPSPVSSLSNESHEQQILAETAAFASKGRYSAYQNLYFPQNLKKQYESKDNFKGGIISTITMGVKLPQDVNYQEPYKTTLHLFGDIADSKAKTRTGDDTLALYYPSTTRNNEVVSKLATTTPEAIIRLIQQNDFTKPAVSEFLLNSVGGDSPNTKSLNLNTATDVPNNMIPILLTNQTREGYTQLFTKMEQPTPTTSSSLKVSDLQSEYSNGLAQSSSSTKMYLSDVSLRDKLRQKGTPDFRQLAQIFSRALSAYLENPEQFRKVLSEVRPTEPPGLWSSLKAAPLSDDEVLTFSDDSERMRRVHHPINTTTSQTSVTAIRNPETFAEEINNFMLTEQLLHNLADSGEFNVNDTYYPAAVAAATVTTTALFPTTSTSTADNISFTVSPLIDFTLNAMGTTVLPSTNDRVIMPSSTTSFPAKNSLYDDLDVKSYSDENKIQSVGEEQLLVTADTQSFVSRNNLLKYRNNVNYKQPQSSVPKTSAYPRLNIRTTGVTSQFQSQYPFFSSRTDFPHTVSTTLTTTAKAPTTLSSNYEFPTHTKSYPPETFAFQAKGLEDINRNQHNDDEDGHLPIAFSNVQATATTHTAGAIFNKSAVQAMMDVMEEAKTNTALRNKLVLLLVNDKNLPENRSIREMKSKLLRALLVPQTTRALYFDDSSTNIFSRSASTESRLNYGTGSDPVGMPSYTTPSNAYYSTELNKNLVQRSNQATTTLQPDQQSVITTSPKVPSNCSVNELSNADSRAVDLLKTLYSIASSNQHRFN